MLRPTNNQILELWRDLQASAYIDHPDPPLELMIVRFADSLLDQWQNKTQRDLDLDSLFDNSNYIWAEDETEDFENE